MTNLKILDKDNAIAVFTSDGMEKTLRKIEKEVLSFVPDISSAKGRKEIASLAFKVAKSKTALDSAGKTLTTDWKAKAKLVDQARKEARDFLDALKDKVRQPLTEWEADEHRKSEQAKIKAELEAAHSDAISMNDLFNREAAIAEKERLAAEKEAEQLHNLEVARIATEKIEHERLIKEQAAEQAKLQAERDAQASIDKAKRFEAEAMASAEKFKREAMETEANRLKSIEDARVAQEQAVFEAQEKVRIDFEQSEKKRLEIAEEEDRKAEIKASNLQHQKDVNNKVLKIFADAGLDSDIAKSIIRIVLKSKSNLITVNY